MERLKLALRLVVEAEGQENPGEQGIHVPMGVGNEAGGKMLPMLGENLLDQCGFSHPRFAAQHDKSCSVQNAVLQCRQGEPMRLSPVQKVRIGDEREWPDSKLIK